MRVPRTQSGIVTGAAIALVASLGLATSPANAQPNHAGLHSAATTKQMPLASATCPPGTVQGTSVPGIKSATRCVSISDVVAQLQAVSNPRVVPAPATPNTPPTFGDFTALFKTTGTKDLARLIQNLYDTHDRDNKSIIRRFAALTTLVNDLTDPLDALKVDVANARAELATETAKLSGRLESIESAYLKDSDLAIVRSSVAAIQGKLGAIGDTDVATQLSDLASGTSDLTTGLEELTATVDTKADQSSVDDLQGIVDSKADGSALGDLQSTVESLSTVVDSKADESALAELSTAVDGKADQTSVEALESGLEDLASVVEGKADQSAVDDVAAALGDLASAVEGKADQSGLDDIKAQY